MLSSLKPGESARVVDFPRAGSAFLRLREMGLLPGTTVTFVRVAPLGDPVEIRIRGYNLTLRRVDADQISVENTSGAGSASAIPVSPDDR